MNMTTKKAEPFLLRPVGKDYLWGGRRLNDDFSKKIDMEPLAETWECSTHADGTSIVVSGAFAGMGLDEVLHEHPEFLGTHPSMGDKLPILIKFIDAKKDLSVQVHPNDEYAKKYENGSLGKSEMWYVLDAAKNAQLIYGFNSDITKSQLKKSLQKGTIERYLQKIPVKKGDVFFVEAGTVHAICAGALVAEIQESSNLTYRLYDYDRVDKNGEKRELHIDKALKVANLSASNTPKQPVRVMRYRRGSASELLCRCKYFQVERMLVNTEQHREMIDFHTENNSFQVLLCVDGCGTLFWENGNLIPFIKGDCIFVPAGSVQIKIHGKAQILNVMC